MIIEQPVEEDAEVVAWGNPWHGLAVGGTLATGIGGITRAWPEPDSGDCFMVKAPGTPAVSRDAGQLALDASQGHAWRDYALMTGWNSRQLYGKPIAGGHLGWVYCAEYGRCWAMNASALSVGGTSLGGTVSAKSLRLDGTTATQSVSAASSWPGQPTCEDFEILDISEDGKKIIIGAFDRDPVAGYNFRYYPTIARGMKVSTDASNNANGANLWHPSVLILLTFSGGTAASPTITCAASLLTAAGDSYTAADVPDGLIPTMSYTRSYINNGDGTYTHSLTGYAGTASPGTHDETRSAVIGAYFKADSTVGMIRLESAWAGARSDTYLADAPTTTTSTQWPAGWGYGHDSNQTGICTLNLLVDGVIKSTVQYTGSVTHHYRTEGDGFGGTTDTTTTTPGVNLTTLDGVTVSTSSCESILDNRFELNVGRVCQVGYAEIYAMRWNNGGYGFLAWDITTNNKAVGWTAGGIIDLKTGVRGTAHGAVTYSNGLYGLYGAQAIADQVRVRYNLPLAAHEFGAGGYV